MSTARRVAAIAMVCVIVGATYVYFAGSVDKSITAEDREALAAVIGPHACTNSGAFEDQIRCIQTIQATLKQRIPEMKCAARGERIEPASFVRRQHGCCYDRARFLEKALAVAGFTSRHVALYDASRFGIFSAFIPGVASHATLEVKTVRGWMGVDSNELFVLLTSEGQPVTYRDVQNTSGLKTAPTPASFYSRPLIAIYGLYSRHGMFHGLNLPSPEINLADFWVYNFAVR